MQNLFTKIEVKLIILSIVLLFVALVIIAFESEGHENQLRISRIIKVYDGDTVYIDIDGIPPVFGKNIGVRIPGIDTPEIRVSIINPNRECLKEMGKDARNYLAKLLKSGKSFVLLNPQRDKYFRLLADISVDGKSAREYMLASKHARPYDGGFKPAWECKSE